MEGVNPNDSDFLKYIPDVLLNEEQKAGKAEGIKREEEKLAELRIKTEEKKRAQEARRLQTMKVNTKYSLPSPALLNQQIQNDLAQQDAAYNGPTPGEGQKPRQFADQTAQESPAMPDYVKQYLWNSYGEHFYDVDSNREQVERSWQRVQQNGMEAERNRLMSLDRFSADDTAEANLLMAIIYNPFRKSNPAAESNLPLRP